MKNPFKNLMAWHNSSSTSPSASLRSSRSRLS
jgi:hypothetical protein